jgi:hypothetical protein
MKAHPALINGANTDVTLSFSALDLTIASNPPVEKENPLYALIGNMAMQGAWYLGTTIADDPNSVQWDTNRGQYWAKVFPATHENHHGILIIQQNFPLPGNPLTNGQPSVRIFMGHYSQADNLFFGHGADNWANELFSFTLKPGACDPSIVPTQ